MQAPTQTLTQALSHLTGWLAVASLLASLATSLASRLLREHRPRLVAWRRLLGLGGALAALVHACVSVVALLAVGSLDETITIVSAVPYLRHGALALALLAPLALTSFPALNARLGLRTWQSLHRAVYVVIALVVLHVLAGPSADPRVALAIAALAVLSLVARLPWPRRAPNETTTNETTTDAPLTTESADNP